MAKHLDLGKAGEDAAVRALEAAGCRILERNVAIGNGEIDIVARDGRTTVLAEVKCRRPSAFGSAAESLTAGKVRRLARAARAYVESRRLGGKPVRCDFIAVDVDPDRNTFETQIFRDAIDLDAALRDGTWQR
ncbi:MAG: YraN family protein [Planctomycetota bacterium]